MTPKTQANQDIRLEQLKEARGRTLVRVHSVAGLWVERQDLIKLMRSRQHELREIKRGLKRLRGLLGDL